MKKKSLSLASKIMCGRGQNHYVFLAGIIISENYKFAKMSTRKKYSIKSKKNNKKNTHTQKKTQPVSRTMF